jgi:hypothetical protein
MRKLPVLLVLSSLSGPLYAQWFDWQSPLVPRGADGRPNLAAPVPKTADGGVDLSGLWVPQGARGSLFDASKIRGWAIDAMAAAEETFYTADPRFHCLPSGPSAYPAGPSVGGIRRMVQHPDLMAVLNPDMTYRQIFMDGRELEPEPLLPTWLGYSVGRWDGDTLVVESNGYNDKTWLTREGLSTSSSPTRAFDRDGTRSGLSSRSGCCSPRSSGSSSSCHRSTGSTSRSSTSPTP